MSCGAPKPYAGINTSNWSDKVESSETFRSLSSPTSTVIIAIATLIIALLTFLKK